MWAILGGLVTQKMHPLILSRSNQCQTLSGLRSALYGIMSDFLVRILEIIAHIFHGRPESPRFSVLGDEYEPREARRSAAWVFAILAILFLLGWWVWRRLTP